MEYILWPQVLWFGATWPDEVLLYLSPQVLYSMIQDHALSIVYVFKTENKSNSYD